MAEQKLNFIIIIVLLTLGLAFRPFRQKHHRYYSYEKQKVLRENHTFSGLVKSRVGSTRSNQEQVITCYAKILAA